MSLADQTNDLIQAALGGSDQAFSRLVETNQGALRAFLRRSCGDWGLAEDLAQETFLLAWERMDRFDPQASFRAWLFGIGYRLCLAALRKDRRAKARDRAWLETRGAASEADLADRMALDQAMSDLPLDQRASVALCLAGDFSHAEASEVLSLPLGTVKSHVARGRARLIEALGGKE